MSRFIKYHIEIDCEINEAGAVIPYGSNVSVTEGENEELLNMAKLPKANTIMNIWIGDSLKFPKIHE